GGAGTGTVRHPASRPQRKCHCRSAPEHSLPPPSVRRLARQSGAPLQVPLPEPALGAGGRQRSGFPPISLGGAAQRRSVGVFGPGKAWPSIGCDQSNSQPTPISWPIGIRQGSMSLSTYHAAANLMRQCLRFGWAVIRSLNAPVACAPAYGHGERLPPLRGLAAPMAFHSGGAASFHGRSLPAASSSLAP